MLRYSIICNFFLVAARPNDYWCKWAQQKGTAVAPRGLAVFHGSPVDPAPVVESAAEGRENQRQSTLGVGGDRWGCAGSESYTSRKASSGGVYNGIYSGGVYNGIYNLQRRRLPPTERGVGGRGQQGRVWPLGASVGPDQL